MKLDAVNPLADVYDRPGFMIRRAHQIAESIFNNECRASNLTNTQRGVLLAVHRMPGLDQTGISRLMGLDKSTVALVVRNLAGRKLLVLLPDESDRRRHHIEATPAGVAMLDKTEKAIMNAQRRLMSPFSAAEQKTLVGLLSRLADAFNDVTGSPIDDRPILEAALRERTKSRRRKRIGV